MYKCKFNISCSERSTIPCGGKPGENNPIVRALNFKGRPVNTAVAVELAGVTDALVETNANYPMFVGR